MTCATDSGDTLINPMFTELDTSTCVIRFVCHCGQIHTRDLPADQLRQWSWNLLRAGARVFDGAQGDLDLAWKD
jgi:hypothetical protein